MKGQQGARGSFTCPPCLFFAARFFFVYFVWESQRTEERSMESWKVLAIQAPGPSPIYPSILRNMKENPIKTRV